MVITKQGNLVPASMRHFAVSYANAWLVQYKPMVAVVECGGRCRGAGDVRCSGICLSDQLTAQAGGTRHRTAVRVRKFRNPRRFARLDSVLGDLKARLNGSHDIFDVFRGAHRDPAAFAHLFNRRLNLHKLPAQLAAAVAICPPMTGRAIRASEADC